MRLTDEQVMQDNKRFAYCNELAELKYCGWDIPHRKSITNDEIHFYAWLCRSAVAMLKEQEAVVRCKECKYGHHIVCATNGEVTIYRVFCTKPYVEQGNATHEPDWFCADGEKEGRKDGKM